MKEQTEMQEGAFGLTFEEDLVQVDDAGWGLHQSTPTLQVLEYLI